MRKYIIALLLLAALPLLAQNVPIYFNQGATELHIGSGGTFYVDSGGTLSTGSGSLITQSANLTLDDGTGASPNFTLTDATDETIVFSKVDAGYCTATTVAGDGLNILVGNLKVGNGTPGLTINGEDFYCEGVSEFDALITADAGLTVTGAAVNLNASSNFAVNVASGTSTGAVAIGSGTGTQSVTIASGTGDLALSSTDDITLTTNTAVGDAITVTNTQGTAAEAIALTATAGGITLTPNASSSVKIAGALTTTSNVGAAAGTCTAVEYGDGAIHKTVITLDAVGVQLADGAHGGGELIYTFPQGVVKILGTTLDGAVTNTANFEADTNDTFSFALGQVVGADDNDLTSTEASIFAKVTEDTTSGTVTTRASDGYFATDLSIDGHTAAATVYANWAIAAACNTATANDFTLTGTVTITWVNLGDY